MASSCVTIHQTYGRQKIAHGDATPASLLSKQLTQQRLPRPAQPAFASRVSLSKLSLPISRAAWTGTQGTTRFRRTRSVLKRAAIGGRRHPMVSRSCVPICAAMRRAPALALFPELPGLSETLAIRLRYDAGVVMSSPSYCVLPPPLNTPPGTVSTFYRACDGVNAAPGTFSEGPAPDPRAGCLEGVPRGGRARVGVASGGSSAISDAGWVAGWFSGSCAGWGLAWVGLRARWEARWADFWVEAWGLVASGWALVMSASAGSEAGAGRLRLLPPLRREDGVAGSLPRDVVGVARDLAPRVRRDEAPPWEPADEEYDYHLRLQSYYSS